MFGLEDERLEKICELEKKNAEIIARFDKHAIDFYAWMQDGYKQVSDGFVQKMELGVSNPIITIEQAMKLYHEDNQ